MYVHTHARAHSSRIYIFSVQTRSIRQRDEPPLFFSHEDNVCGLSDISGWIYHMRYIAPHRDIYVRITAIEDANMRKCSFVVYIIWKKKICMHGHMQYSSGNVRHAWRIYTFARKQDILFNIIICNKTSYVLLTKQRVDAGFQNRCLSSIYVTIQSETKRVKPI